jgi:Protein of unknown function (DUF2550)
MAVWQWLLDSAGVIVLVLVFLVAALVIRRRLISRHDGTFELSVRDGSLPDGRGWVLGLGRYREDSLEWYRIFSPLPVPKRSWRRSDLSVVSQRVPRKAEEFALYAGSVVVVCTTPRGETELAMSRSSLTGLQSWLEAGPPGSSPAL